jgi:hypothetical protein
MVVWCALALAQLVEPQDNNEKDKYASENREFHVLDVLGMPLTHLNAKALSYTLSY